MNEERPSAPDEPNRDDELREEEEASDRARGRTAGPGQAPKLDEIPVPKAKDAPTPPHPKQ